MRVGVGWALPSVLVLAVLLLLLLAVAVDVGSAQAWRFQQQQQQRAGGFGHQQHYANARHQQQQQQQQRERARQQAQQQQQRERARQQAQRAQTQTQTHYEVLQVPTHASDETIKKAYRRLAKVYHPDKNKDNTEHAQAQFVLLSEAYETLSDPQRRAVYDDGLRYGHAHSSPQHHHQQQQQHFTAEDIFRSMFQQQQQQQQQQWARQEEDVEETVHVFQGPDGRVYYERRRQPRRNFQQRSFHFELSFTSLWSLLWPLVFGLVVLNTLTNCCADPTKRQPSTQQQQQKMRERQQRLNPNQQVNIEDDEEEEEEEVVQHKRRPTAAASPMPPIPTLTLSHLQSKSFITVVALNDISRVFLTIVRKDYRNDPLLFAQASGDLSDCEPECSRLLELAKSRSETARSCCENPSALCLIALRERGSRYSWLCVNDDCNADRAMAVQSTRAWLERMIEGRVTWHSNN